MTTSDDIFIAQHCVIAKRVPLGVVLACACGFQPWLGENEAKALTEHLFKESRAAIDTPPEGEDERVRQIRTRYVSRSGLPQMNATLADEQQDLDDIAFLLTLVQRSEKEQP